MKSQLAEITQFFSVQGLRKRKLQKLVSRARALRGVGSVDDEIQAWQACLQLEKLREAQKRLYQIFSERGDVDSGLPHLAQLVEKNPDWRRLLAQQLTGQRKYSEAAEHITLLAEERPNDMLLLQWLARVAAITKNGQLAADAWSRVQKFGAHYLADEYQARIEILKPDSAPRVAILGNCQVYPIAKCLRLISPAHVISVSAQDFVEPRLAAVVADEIEEFDFIVSQPLQGNAWGDLQTELLRKRRSDIIMMPSILFTGLQPDLLHIPAERWTGPKHTFLEFHSALILAAFIMGVREERVIDLFNTYIFSTLGYFDEYDVAKQFLLDDAASHDFELHEEMEDWERRGMFVFTPNHPDVQVLWSIAKRLAQKMNIPISTDASPPAGSFRENVWPLYPDLAKRRGLVGSLMFQPPKQPSVHLREMIATDYAAYSATDFSTMVIPRAAEITETLRKIGLRP
jgi:hypothetical protein